VSPRFPSHRRRAVAWLLSVRLPRLVAPPRGFARCPLFSRGGGSAETGAVPLLRHLRVPSLALTPPSLLLPCSEEKASYSTSQPEPGTGAALWDGGAAGVDKLVQGISFSQPACPEHMLVNSQLLGTPGSSQVRGGGAGAGVQRRSFRGVGAQRGGVGASGAQLRGGGDAASRGVFILGCSFAGFSIAGCKLAGFGVQLCRIWGAALQYFGCRFAIYDIREQLCNIGVQLCNVHHLRV